MLIISKLAFVFQLRVPPGGAGTTNRTQLPEAKVQPPNSLPESSVREFPLACLVFFFSARVEKVMARESVRAKAKESRGGKSMPGGTEAVKGALR